MNCGHARRYLFKYDSTELKVIPHSRVARHLNCCPGCERMRGLFLKLTDDLRVGSELESKKIEQLRIDWKRKPRYKGSSEASFIRKLDWLLMPELTLKWVLPVLAIIVVGYLSNKPVTENQPSSVGFPNDLVISRGHVIVTLEPNSGLHLTNKSVGASDQRKSSSDEVISKGAI